MTLSSQIQIVARECGQVLACAKDEGVVLDALYLLHHCFVLPVIGKKSEKLTKDRDEGVRQDATDHLLSQLRLFSQILLDDTVAQIHPTYLSRGFFWDCFLPFSDVLLAVVAVDWLPSFQPPQRSLLFNSLWNLAPAPLALASLVGHLSQVQPASSDKPSGVFATSSSVTAIASATAIELLASRFGAANSYGTLELVAVLAAAQGSATGHAFQQHRAKCTDAHVGQGHTMMQSMGDGVIRRAYDQASGLIELASVAEVLDLMLQNCAAVSCVPNDKSRTSSSGDKSHVYEETAGGNRADDDLSAQTSSKVKVARCESRMSSSKEELGRPLWPLPLQLLPLPQQQPGKGSSHHHCLNPEHLVSLLVSLPDRLPPQACTHTSRSSNHVVVNTKSTSSSSNSPDHIGSRNSSSHNVGSGVLLGHEAFYRHVLSQLFLAAHAPHAALQLLGQSLFGMRAEHDREYQSLVGMRAEHDGEHQREGGGAAQDRGSTIQNSSSVQTSDACNSNVGTTLSMNSAGSTSPPQPAPVFELIPQPLSSPLTPTSSSAVPPPHTLTPVISAPQSPAAEGCALAAVAAAASQLVCGMLEKLVRRGFGALAADVLLEEASIALQEGDGRSSALPKVLSTVMHVLLDLGPGASFIAERVLQAVLTCASQASAAYAGAAPYEEPGEEQARQKALVLAQKQQHQWGRPSQHSQPAGEQQQQPEGRVVPTPSPDAVQLLSLLLPPSVLNSHSVQYLLTDKFLLGQQRHAMLPTSALHLMLDFLGASAAWERQQESRQPLSSQPHTQGQQHPDLEVKPESEGPDSFAWWLGQLRGSFQDDHDADTGTAKGMPCSKDSNSTGAKDAYVALLVILSQAWGEVHDPSMAARHANRAHNSGRNGPVPASLQVSVPQQAYISCMLVCVLRRLQRSQVERCSGVLASLLQGVSARLASPLHATRLQAMRVGKALSYLLTEDLQPSHTAAAPAEDSNNLEGYDGSRPAGASPGPLFVDQGHLGLIVEELWPGALPNPTHPHTLGRLPMPHSPHQEQHQGGLLTGQQQQQHGKPGKQNRDQQQQLGKHELPGQGNGEVEEEGVADSDDDSDYEAYDVQEHPEDNTWRATDPQSLQLRALSKALTKADDVNGVLKALGHVELMVRAAPDELPVVASELSRALLYCRVPDWAEVEASSVDERPEFQRARCLAALAAATPQPSGDALLAELYSPNLDVAQRLLILDCLCAAAQELAAPASAAPRIGEARPGGAPKLLPPEPPKPKPALMRGFLNNSSKTKSTTTSTATANTSFTSTATANTSLDADSTRSNGSASSSSQSSALSTKEAGPGKDGMRASRTRVWGHVALQKRGVPPPKVFRNRAVSVVLRWTTALLRQVDVKQHGIDLFGRDALILGRVVSTLGTFAECASGSDAAVPLVSAIMELLMAPQVHNHAEAYVRRAVLLAAGQAVSAIPAPRLAAAMLSSSSGRDPMDAALVRQMEWLQCWLSDVQQQDADSSCALMAGACCNLQAALAAEATIALGSTDLSALQGHGAGSLLLGQGGLGLLRQPVNLNINGLQQARVTPAVGGKSSLITELS